MIEDQKIIILPLHSVKSKKTTQFPKNSQQVTTALGNEGLDLLKWIQNRVDDGDLIISGGGGGSNTDLSFTQTSSNVTINSSNGNDITIPSATQLLSGFMSATDKIQINALQSLVGVSAYSSNLGTFTGNIIPDNVNIKVALQSLESAINLSGGGNGIYGGSNNVPPNTTATTLGAFTIDNVATAGRQIRIGGITGSPTTRYGINILHNQLTIGGVFGTSGSLISFGSSGTSVYGDVYNYLKTSTTGLYFTFNQDSIVEDTRISPKGLEYGDDYSNTFTNNSLVSKLYVDNAITGYTVNHNNLASLQGGTLNEYYHLSQSVYNKLNNLVSSSILGRRSGTDGEVEKLNLTGSLQISSTNISLVNDSNIPGNNKYYGTDSSGVKGFYSIGTSTITSFSVTDTADIDLTVSNPTTTPNLTADLLPTGVIANTYGSVSESPIITVDSKGRITSATTSSININTNQINGFNESVDDRVGSLLQAGSGITLTYNDPSNTLTIAATSTYTDENAQDAVAGMMFNNSDITWSYDDVTPRLYGTLSPTGVSAGTYGSSSQTLQIQTDVAGRIYNINSFPISVNSTQISDFSEAVDDRVANLLQAGTNITLSYNDVAGTLTINSTGGGGGTFTGYTTIQEEGSALAARTVLNFIGSGITASDNTGATRTDVSLSGELNAIASLSSTGILSRTAANTYVPRTLIQSTDILISNANGVSGNPTFSLSDTGVSTGTWGTANTIPQITIDSKGRITAATAVGVNASPNRYYLEGTTGTSFNTASTGVFKDKDGNNASFIFNSSTKVGIFKNGLKLGESGTGTTRDYIATAPSTITFSTSLLTTDVIIIEQYA